MVGARATPGPGLAGNERADEWQVLTGLLSIKNTFFEFPTTQIEQLSGPQRRAQSQPAPCREPASPASSTSTAASDTDEVSPPDSNSEGSVVGDDRLLCFEGCETESTEAPSDVSEGNAASTKSECGTSQDKKALCKPCTRSSGTKQVLMTQEALISYQQTEHLLHLLAPQATSRQSINCDVHSWLPVAPPNLPALPDYFMQHTCQVVMSAAAVLAASAHPVIDVHTTRDRKGWSIVAKLRPEDLGHTDEVVSWAKQAVLQAASESLCVYVMGYRRNPFRPRPHGFGAILGLMQDEHMACWDVYNTGHCRREAACHWTHPASVKRLYFVVRPLVPEGVDPWEVFKEMEESGKPKGACAGGAGAGSLDNDLCQSCEQWGADDRQ